MNYSVYVHVFPNGKLYIGVTRQEPKKRWRSGGGYRNQKAMYEAILKYGWDNIKHIVLVSNLKEDMAMEIEKALIENIVRKILCMDITQKTEDSISENIPNSF